MSEATLLEMCNTVATEVRFPAMTNIIGNSNENAVAIYTALKKAMERDVYRAQPWSALRSIIEITFDGTTEFWPLPLNYDSIINSTAWDIVNLRPARGALDPYQWQKVTNMQLAYPGVFMYYTITSHEFLVQPGQEFGGVKKCIRFFPEQPVLTPPGPGFTAAYMSNYYVIDASTRNQKRVFESDGDLTLIDSELVEQATLVRMLRTLGLGFAAEKEEFHAMLKNRSEKDGGATVLNMAGTGVGVGYPNTPGFVPGGGWWGGGGGGLGWY